MFVTLTKEALLRLVLEVAVGLSPGQCVSIDLLGFQAGAPILNLPKNHTGEALVVVWKPHQIKSLTGGVVPKQPSMGAMQLALGVKRPFVCAGPDKVSPLLMVHEVGHLKEFLEGGDEALKGKFSFFGLPSEKHLRAEEYADSYLFSKLKENRAAPTLCERFGRALKSLTSRDPRLAEEDPFITGYPRDSERVAACKAALSE